MPEAACPPGWDAQAHVLWREGQAQPAIQAVLARINAQGARKALPSVLQLAYYVFLAGDPAAAAAMLDQVRPQHPANPELLLNLAVCLSRSGQAAAAAARARELIAIEPTSAAGYDTLCSALHQLGDAAGAAAAGTAALRLKDASCAGTLPAMRAQEEAAAVAAADAPGRARVIAYSLWGDVPRYLRGALDNALAAAALYPGWRLRFHVDDSVPPDLLAALAALGADLRREPPGQALRERLGWRFQVANDPDVGRFLVRDVDSVPDARERAAVDAWLASGRCFHVMRDWWTHTDLVLAGLWGGISGVLPPVAQRLRDYAPGVMETPNVDQWFLRDELWRFIRRSCLVHDRCFAPPGAQPWPLAPGTGHVGQNAFAAQSVAQAARLRDWAGRVPSLRLAGAQAA